MNQQVLEFIGVWGFIISIIGFVVMIVLLAFNLWLIHRQQKIAETQNQTQIQIAREQFETQRKIAEQQFRIEVLSRNRQEWINSLREEMAKYLSQLSELVIAFGPNPRSENIQKANVILSEATIVGHRIRLMLNPSEAMHAEYMGLNKQVGAVILNYIQGKVSEGDATNQFLHLQRELLRLSSDILKTEWERVKRGE